LGVFRRIFRLDTRFVARFIRKVNALNTGRFFYTCKFKSFLLRSERFFVLSLTVPLHAGAHSLHHERIDQVGTDDVLPKLLLLEELQVLDSWAGVGQVLEKGRASPVLQVGKVVDKSGVREVLARGEMVQVLRIGNRLNKLL